MPTACGPLAEPDPAWARGRGWHERLPWKPGNRAAAPSGPTYGWFDGQERAAHGKNLPEVHWDSPKRHWLRSSKHSRLSTCSVLVHTTKSCAHCRARAKSTLPSPPKNVHLPCLRTLHPGTRTPPTSFPGWPQPDSVNLVGPQASGQRELEVPSPQEGVVPSPRTTALTDATRSPRHLVVGRRSRSCLPHWQDDRWFVAHHQVALRPVSRRQRRRYWAPPSGHPRDSTGRTGVACRRHSQSELWPKDVPGGDSSPVGPLYIT